MDSNMVKNEPVSGAGPIGLGAGRFPRVATLSLDHIPDRKGRGFPDRRLVAEFGAIALMKGATLKATLKQLGVHQPLARPRVSNDNPFSEPNFRTVKYRPNYPQEPCESQEAAPNGSRDSSGTTKSIRAAASRSSYPASATHGNRKRY